MFRFRWRRCVRVEAKLLGPDANHISAAEGLRVAGARPVDEHTIRAEIADDVSGRANRQFSVIPRHVGPRDDDVRSRITSYAKSGWWNRVFASVDERDQSATRNADPPAIRGRSRRGRATERRHQHGAARLAIIGEAELTPGHLDPVSVEQRRRLCTKRHTIHQYRGPRRCSAHGGCAARVYGEDCENSLLSTSIDSDAGIVIRPYSQLANAQLDLLVVKPNMSHAGSGGDRCAKPKGKWKAR